MSNKSSPGHFLTEHESLNLHVKVNKIYLKRGLNCPLHTIIGIPIEGTSNNVILGMQIYARLLDQGVKKET